MESKTDGFVAELEVHDTRECGLLSFELYEEYSQRPIADTIRECRENFEKATNKEQLLDDVEGEIKSFCVWLEETKNLDPAIAYHIAVSLKSLLFGFPAGVQVAQLFGMILDRQFGK